MSQYIIKIYLRRTPTRRVSFSQISVKNKVVFPANIHDVTHLTAMMMDKFNLKYYSSCYSDRTTIRRTPFERAKQEISIHVTKIVTHLKCGPEN